MRRTDPKLIGFYLIFTLSLLWIVGAYGSVSAWNGQPSTFLREYSRWALGISGLAAIFLLPGKRILPRRLPMTPRICLAFLFLWACLVVFNGKYDHHFHELILKEVKDVPMPSAPGTIVKSTSFGYLLELCAVILFILGISRATEGKAWKGILIVIAISGVVVAMTGLTHKLVGARHIFGIGDFADLKMANLPKFYFAPFVYNANAASYMNLALCACLALAVQTHHTGSGRSKAFGLWLVAAGLCAVGVISSASKAGAAILVFQGGLFVLVEAGYFLKKYRQGRHSGGLGTERKVLIGVGVVIFLAATVFSMNTLISRISHMSELKTADGEVATIAGRAEMRGIVWDLIVDKDEGGWAGFGPGTFGHIMPYYHKPHHTAIGQRWDYAHCDPLQTILEWGYLGALAWFVLGIGSLARGIYLLVIGAVPKNLVHIYKGLCIGLVGVGIHSTYDFPLSVLSVHLVAITFCSLLWCLPCKPKANGTEAKSSA